MEWGNPKRKIHGLFSKDRRLRREMRTVRVMIDLYCRDRHGGRKGLCAECLSLWEYARERVERCPYGAEKPTCVNCPVHCYRPAMRERIREVMRYSGPRMMTRHPVLSLFHLLDGRRPAPEAPWLQGASHVRHENPADR